MKKQTMTPKYAKSAKEYASIIVAMLGLFLMASEVDAEQMSIGWILASKAIGLLMFFFGFRLAGAFKHKNTDL